METDELEFLISQHFDGTLDAAEASRLQQQLADSAGARSLFEEHAKLDAALRGSSAKLALDESWLSTQISERIDEASARPMRIRDWGWAAPAAMAACLAIGLSVGSFFRPGENTSEQIARTPPATQPSIAAPAVAEIAIAVPPAQPQRRTGYATVSVGAPANLTPQIVSALYLAQDFNAARVSIRAAGHRQLDAFD